MKNEPQLYESRLEKNESLPFYMYKIQARQDETTVYAHWHEEVEIQYAACSGVITLDGASFPFQPGDIVFINRDQLHCATAHSHGLIYAMVFPYSFLDFKHSDFCQTQILDKLNARKLRLPVIVSREEEAYPKLQSCAEEIMRQYDGAIPGKELKIKCCLYEILFLLYAGGRIAANEKAGGFSHEQLGYVKAGIQFMESNLQQHLSVEEIAKSVSISKFHFIKTFKQITGVTPIIYLRDLRVKKAADYLTAGYPVTQAAYLSGFNNLSYFIRSFRQRYHVSPKAFQMQAQ